MNLPEALKLYLVTDPLLCGPRGMVETCSLALRGGVRCVQYRDKGAATGDLLVTGRVLASRVREYGGLFLVNDRVDVALAVGADGVHLGQDDMPAAEARRLMGPGAVIGISVRTPEEARRAWKDGADYLAANIVFETPTKPDARPPLGLSGVRILAGASPLPLVAIGGIHPGNARSVREAGAMGVAVVSAVMAAPDPEEAVREFLRVL